MNWFALEFTPLTARICEIFVKSKWKQDLFFTSVEKKLSFWISYMLWASLGEGLNIWACCGLDMNGGGAVVLEYTLALNNDPKIKVYVHKRRLHFSKSFFMPSPPPSAVASTPSLADNSVNNASSFFDVLP